TVTNWTIPALPWFAASQIVFGLDVFAPMDATNRTMAANLHASLSINDQLQVILDGGYNSADGIINLSWVGQPLNAVPISSLSSLISTQEVPAGVPAEMPVDGLFFLKTLAFIYDTHQSYLVSVDLELEALVEWTIITNVLALNGFTIELYLDKTGPTAAAT